LEENFGNPINHRTGGTSRNSGGRGSRENNLRRGVYISKKKLKTFAFRCKEPLLAHGRVFDPGVDEKRNPADPRKRMSSSRKPKKNRPATSGESTSSPILCAAKREKFHLRTVERSRRRELRTDYSSPKGGLLWKYQSAGQE